VIHRALEWNRQLPQDSALTKAQIAAREGISRARVSQVIGLLQLPAEAQTFLAQLGDSKKLRFFTERRLRQVLSVKEPAAVARAWGETIEESGRAD
jgi:hypothetical protein